VSDSVRLFFSHATEDKATVLQVAERLRKAHPELQPWIDTFEIVGGQALLDKIAEGMDSASRFFVFLSPVSVKKPWVNAELKRALTQEIGGSKPDYVVPVKMGGLTAMPPFIEPKKYIDLDRLSEPEWLAEFHAAATGKGLPSDIAPEQNLQVVPVGSPPGQSHIIQYTVRAQYWAEDIGLVFSTKARAEKVEWAWAAGGQGNPTNYSIIRTPTQAGIMLPGRRIKPGDDLRVTLTFNPGTDAAAMIFDLHEWSGDAANERGTVF
jgi:hypothetical protein